MDHGVGREVKRLREEKNWSMAKLAVEADMSVSGVSMIENGKRNLTTTTLAKLARALEVEVVDLFPLEQPRLPDVPLMARPEVREWLAGQGHMNSGRFPDYALGLGLDIDEEGRPRGLERAIEDLRQTRRRLIEDLKKPATRNTLFPRRTGLPTKEERIKEALRPAKEAWELEWEIRHEYLAREVELINHGRRLHAGGVTSDHLVYAHTAEYERRLDEMTEEAYAVAGAA
jgi:transcriptional regulator with XRE-family HTH domain